MLTFWCSKRVICVCGYVTRENGTKILVYVDRSHGGTVLRYLCMWIGHTGERH